MSAAFSPMVSPLDGRRLMRQITSFLHLFPGLSLIASQKSQYCTHGMGDSEQDTDELQDLRPLYPVCLCGASLFYEIGPSISTVDPATSLRTAQFQCRNVPDNELYISWS